MRKKIIMKVLFFIFISLFLVSCTNNSNINKENIIVEDNQESVDNEVVKEEVEEEAELEEPILEETPIEYIEILPENVRIPILMYHSISDTDPNNGLLVPPEMFDEQMAWLEENGFTAMTMDEAMESMTTGKVPKRPVVITFDDGYADNYVSAFPSLKNHNMKGTFFVITDKTDNDGYYMSSDMLKEMQAAGMSIENHTANHLELNKLSREDAYESIKRAQDYLRNVIGSDGNYLCYPVGRYNDETIQIASELGIKAAVTTDGGKSSVNDGSYKLKRVRIAPMSIEGFAGIFSEYIY